MAKKRIPRDVAHRGNPDEIRFFMGLADGYNVVAGKLPETSSQRLAKAKTNGGKKRKIR